MWHLSVLNAGGRDPEQAFPDGAGEPGPGHAPVNFHGYAACARGAFHARTARAAAAGWPVLLLLRRDLKAGLRALRELQAVGRFVAVTLKEAGAMQVADRLSRPGQARLLGEIAKLADACLAPTPELASLFGDLRGGPKRVAFIPTPYPVDDARWDFSIPPETRRGIFVGTREFGTPSRQHLAALLAAREIGAAAGERVTVINTDGRSGAKLLASLGISKWIEGPLPYASYLREMAGHRLVFQLDRSGVPGQVAGDALLCRLPCVGGDGAIERLVFPGESGFGRTPDQLAALALGLMRDAGRCEAAALASQKRALALVSYRAVAERLEAFFQPAC
jgi:hypothetical protein